MECSLAALIACFSWSNLYIDNQISYQDHRIPYHYWRDVSPPPSQNGAVETAYVWTLGRENPNPYYRGAIGIRMPFKSIDVSAEVFRDTSISMDGQGVNGLALRAQWFPFRR
jgi:hypothetical protein